jgi:hypothetical protein
MNKKIEKDPLQEVFNNIIAVQNVQSQAFDNLFSANHRNAMIRNHGGTQAQVIKIGELLQ